MRAISVRLAFGLVFASTLGACATQDRASTSTVDGNRIAIHLRNTYRGWAMDVDQAAAELARQRPQGLDAPLRLLRVVRPGRLADSEVSIRFAIDPEGRVVDAEVTKLETRLGGEAIGIAMLSAVRLWQFAPPTSGGKPTRYCCRVETFPTLDDAKAAVGPDGWNPASVRYETTTSLIVELAGKAWVLTDAARGPAEGSLAGPSSTG